MHPEPYTIRVMRPTDLAEVAELERVTTADWSEAQLETELSQPGAFHFVGRTASNLLLAFLCGRLAADEAEIYKLTVAPFCRRRGIAGDLLRHTLTHLRHRHAVACFLEVRQSNIAARRLYTKNGFVTVGIRKNYYSGPIEDGLLLKKAL